MLSLEPERILAMLLGKIGPALCIFFPLPATLVTIPAGMNCRLYYHASYLSELFRLLNPAA
jgi:hypothetical protein